MRKYNRQQTCSLAHPLICSLIHSGHPESTWKATRHPPRHLQMKKMRMTKIGKAPNNNNNNKNNNCQIPTKFVRRILISFNQASPAKLRQKSMFFYYQTKQATTTTLVRGIMFQHHKQPRVHLCTIFK